jgi:hypothetical protein
MHHCLYLLEMKRLSGSAGALRLLLTLPGRLWHPACFTPVQRSKQNPTTKDMG